MKLELAEVTKKYGEKVALDHVSYAFTEGLYGILGPNGAGKTTLMNLLTDNIAITSGEIRYEGVRISELGRKYRNRIGYMPQQQGFYGQFSGRMFLRYMAQMKGLKKESDRQIEELLCRVSLDSVAHKKIRTYSGGMRQRLLLAQALLGNPEILILDEPTAGLDPKERVRLREYIRDLGRSRIVLFTTHIVSDIETVADQILIFRDGVIVADGSPEWLEEQAFRQETGEKKRTLEDVYLYFTGETI